MKATAQNKPEPNKAKNGATQGTQVGLRIELPPLKKITIVIKVIGDSPLISHRFAQKAKLEMLAKQMKLAQQPQKPKDPHQDFLDSLYPYPGGGYGFPCLAFKNAAVTACTHVAGITKVMARGAFHVLGEYVKIEGEPTMRGAPEGADPARLTPDELAAAADTVRIGMGTTDLRYRAEFRRWSATVRLQFNANVLSAEQIVNLFNTAGFAVGIGEWRPERDGNFGMFHVADEKEGTKA